MKAVYFDAKTGREIQGHEASSGVCGFCSWRRLSEVFQQAGELTQKETLVSYQVDDRGITFRVKS